MLQYIYTFITEAFYIVTYVQLFKQLLNGLYYNQDHLSVYSLSQFFF